MAEQEQAFVVRDRRASGGSDVPPAPTPEAKQVPPPSASQATASQEALALPVTFSSFVISLGSSSLMLMGEQLDPHQEAVSVNLPQAKEIIDLLSVLEEKTKGNLTEEESKMIKEAISNLKVTFVRATGFIKQ